MNLEQRPELCLYVTVIIINVFMVHIHLRKLLWVYCPGHTGVKGNDRAERLAGKAAITSDLCLGRPEVLRSLRLHVGAQPRTSHRRSPIAERRGKRKRSLIFLERTRKEYCQSDEHWDCFKRNAGESSETRWSAYVLFRTHKYHLELKLTELLLLFIC